MAEKIIRSYPQFNETELYQKAKDIVGEQMKVRLASFNPKIDWKDNDKKGLFNVKGVLGSINVKNHDINIIIDKIPMMLKPFKGKIVSSIEKILDDVK